LGRQLPADLEELVLRCLDKDPSRRPQTARELRDALLAVKVNPWTEAQARAWWAKHRSEPRPVRVAESAQPALSAGSIVIDLKRRKTQDVDVA
jgi:serine/threonine-protein kinase